MLSALESAKEIDALAGQAVKLIQGSENVDVRKKAAGILSRHQRFPVSEEALVAMLGDKLIEVRCAAAMILGRRGDAGAVPVIKEGVAAREISRDYLFLAHDLEKG